MNCCTVVTEICTPICSMCYENFPCLCMQGTTSILQKKGSRISSYSAFITRSSFSDYTKMVETDESSLLIFSFCENDLNICSRLYDDSRSIESKLIKALAYRDRWNTGPPKVYVGRLLLSIKPCVITCIFIINYLRLSPTTAPTKP